MQWIANHDAGHGKTPGQPRQGAQVVAAIVVALQREDRLGRDSQFIGDSHADAAIANVEGEVAGMSRGFQFQTPVSSLQRNQHSYPRMPVHQAAFY
jgi:hypothetical protein